MLHLNLKPPSLKTMAGEGCDEHRTVERSEAKWVRRCSIYFFSRDEQPQVPRREAE